MNYSYNGWMASEDRKAIGITPLVVYGEEFIPGVRGGDVHTIFTYLAQQFHNRVEPLVRNDWHQADDWGYYYRLNRNAGNLSCHSSGTAIDINSTRHPNGQSGTFSRTQVAAIRAILSELGGVVKWGGDFSGTKDEMHFEIRGTPYAVAQVAYRLRHPTPAPTPAPNEEITMAAADDIKRHITGALDYVIANLLTPLSDKVGHLMTEVDGLRRDLREVAAFQNRLAEKVGVEERLSITQGATVDGVIES